MGYSDYLELLPQDFDEESQWKTDVSGFDSGKEQRRSRWTSDRKIYHFGYPNAYDSQITTLWDFYRSRKGSWDYFYLVIPPSNTHSETVNGATTVVLSAATKPSPTNITVTLDGTAISDWTYSETTKTITFDSAKTGAIIVTFYEMKLVRFLADSLSREWFLYCVTNQSLDFITV